MENQIRYNLHSLLINEFSSLNLDKETTRILDVGCGDGAFLQRLHDCGFTKLYGMEEGESSIPPYVELEEGYFIDTLPYEDSQFDCIVLLDIIEHVPNQFVLLDEVYRVLRQGGIVILSTPNIFSLFGKINFVFLNRLLGFTDSSVRLKAGWAHINPFIPNIFEIQYEGKFQRVSKHNFGFIVPGIHRFVPVDNSLLSGNLTYFLRKIK